VAVWVGEGEGVEAACPALRAPRSQARDECGGEAERDRKDDRERRECGGTGSGAGLVARLRRCLDLVVVDGGSGGGAGCSDAPIDFEL
jgi:hypothetical protein